MKTIQLKREIRETVLLSGPVVFAQLAQNSMSFVDTVMVGRLGSRYLAGMALGNTTYFFTSIVCMGIVMSVSPMVSQAYGAGDRKAIRESVQSGIVLAVLLTIPAFLLLWNVGWVLSRIGQVPETVVFAQSYLRAMVWGLFPVLAFTALRSFVEAVSRPWPVTVISFVGVAVNIVGDYVLMYGKLGFPALGLVGTGIATSVVYWSMFLCLFAYVWVKPQYRLYAIFQLPSRPNPTRLKELFRIGWPIGVSQGIESGLFVVTALMAGALGTVALAAHQIAIQCAAFTFMVPLGIGIATSVRVGHGVGRRDLPGTRSAGFTGIFLAAAAMIGAALLFWFIPETIISIFLDVHHTENVAVVVLAIQLLGVAAVFQVVDGVQVSAAGALRGMKDTRAPMFIGLSTYWAIGLSVGFALGFVLNRGAVGLWWGLVVGLASAACLLTWRFHHRTHPDRLVFEATPVTGEIVPDQASKRDIFTTSE